MAKKDEDSILESQIGDMGNTSSETGAKSLGKLRDADKIVGNTQESLSQEKEAELSAFLNRSNKARENEENVVSMGDIAGGWVNIPRERMGLRGKFYPETWEFRIKPASVEAIKSWSAIDDTNPYTVNSVFNEIMKLCVTIRDTQTGSAISWQKINSWDRFWFLMLVREYTFVKGEAKIEYEEECPECGGKLTYTLTADSLFYDFPDEEVIESCWNAADKCWYINPADYDVPDMGMIKLFCPTLEKDQMILDWAIKQSQEKHDPSSTLLRFLPWLVERASKDEDNAKILINKAKKIYDSWNTDQFTFMDEVLKNIIVTPKETLRQKCPHCGEEVHSEVRFPNGVRALFSIQNRFKKFGSK